MSSLLIRYLNRWAVGFALFLKIPLKQVRDQAQFGNMLPDALGV
jgi:hypothetical protein